MEDARSSPSGPVLQGCVINQAIQTDTKKNNAAMTVVTLASSGSVPFPRRNDPPSFPPPVMAPSPALRPDCRRITVIKSTEMTTSAILAAINNQTTLTCQSIVRIIITYPSHIRTSLANKSTGIRPTAIGRPEGGCLPPAPSFAQTVESVETPIPRIGAERVLNPQQLVVLRHPICSRRRARLDLPRVGRDRNVGDRRILRLTRAV